MAVARITPNATYSAIVDLSAFAGGEKNPSVRCRDRGVAYFST
jgi:hypothetical protein